MSSDLDRLVEAGARAVHGALSRAHVSAYLDMPDDTADVVSRAHLDAILPLLADDLDSIVRAIRNDYSSPIGDAYDCGKWDQSVRIQEAIRTRLTALGEKQ